MLFLFYIYFFLLSLLKRYRALYFLFSLVLCILVLDFAFVFLAFILKSYPCFVDWVDGLYYNDLCTVFYSNFKFKVYTDLDPIELQRLVQAGVITQHDMDYILLNGDLVASDLEYVFNYRKEHFLRKRDTVKWLMYILQKKHGLSFGYTKYLIAQIDKLIDY